MFRQLTAKTPFVLVAIAILACLLNACGNTKSNLDKQNKVVFAQPLPSGLGFQKVSQIKNARMQVPARAVLKIVIPSGPLVPVESLVISNGLSLPQMYQKIKSDQTNIGLSNDILALQIHRCIQNKAVSCQVRSAFTQATGFAINGGKQMAMTYGTLSVALTNVLTEAQISNMDRTTLQNLDIDLLAYDQNGVAVVDETNPAHIQKVSTDAPDVLDSNSIAAPAPTPAPVGPVMNDYSVLNLPRSLGTGLTLATTAAKSGDTIYIAGYPEATSDRSQSGGGDSDGSGLFFSHGFVVTFPNAFLGLGQDWSAVDDATKLLWQVSALALQADATDNMIGGPIINENGECIGILTSTSPETAKKYSFGINSISF